ncbi:ATP-binding cassette domain-containing protein [Streptomyces sp. HNM0645]|uniref:ATP-binding cassette domain-containing protein n=1 Tax=Streptomyces sp. HNM0645 TaxID=2782343 RepID=UPI0024B7B6C3|nr:ATP-binding cassette domain-containing protein [Streptomyces sp. HNM0645]MDI9887896.1 ATP-binding cassette domain-containing protein [Streptomyces sp. HNM0645]
MLQAIGLTSTSRRYLAPAVDDLTFEARPGDVTALLGARGSGKSTALRLMLGLEEGRGVTYFRGRPLHGIASPAREVGVLLGDVPGHPARTARGQLRMLCAAAGVPVSRADDMLDLVGIAALRDARLGSLSLGMDRRLGLAAALVGDPHTLLLDAPSRDSHRASTAGCSACCVLTPHTAGRSSTRPLTPRRRPGPRIGWSPSTRAGSSPTRTWPTSPGPGSGRASPS